MSNPAEHSGTIEIPEPLVAALRRARHVAVLTGSGISAESGVPTFRDAQTGLWSNFRPEELATPEAFQRNPKLVWEWYAWRRGLASQAQPNAGHLALVELERRVPQFSLITQNVDGLHQRAGSRNVIELHGNITRTKCFEEDVLVETWTETDETPPRCRRCGGRLRPDVVWFGEALPPDAIARAFAASQSCDLFFSIGTSTLVHPAASLPFEALQHGGTVVEINPDETPLTSRATFALRGPSGVILPGILRTLGVALLVLAGTIPSFAGQTFYVSPSGNNNNPGTQTQPFREIRKAIAVVAPGDAILVTDGSYLGFDMFDQIGASNAPITIRALGTNAVVAPTTDRSDNRDTIHIEDCAYVIVDGFHSFNANRAAVRVQGGHHVAVRNCVFGNNTTWGLFTAFSDDLLIENNECYGSVTQHGIYVSNSGDRPSLRGNRCHDNAGAGIQLNADVTIQPGDGTITGALLENNVIYNNGAAGGGAFNLDGVQDSIIRNNLLFNNHASGIIMFQIDGAEGPRGNQVYHNTIDMAADGRWALNFLQTTGTNVARNNILLTRHSFRGGLRFGNTNDVAHTDSDYNILTRITPDDSAILTLAEWQAQGRELHSITGSTSNLFVDAMVGNYHLLAGAAAVDIAQMVATVTIDLEGSVRPFGGAPDIGCYELSPFTLKLFPVNGGQYLLRLNGGAGRSYQLESASVLTDWTASATLTQSNRSLEYLEANPPPGKRFYRASSSP